jgi:hypothetical protein
MVSAEALQEAFKANLPSEVHEQAILLANLIATVLNSEDQNSLTTTPEFISLLQQLVEKKLPTTEGLITIGEGSQVGDVMVQDVAGNNIIKVTVNAPQASALPVYPITVLSRPREEVEAELQDLMLRGKVLHAVTTKNAHSSSFSSFAEWSKNWHLWRRKAEQVLSSFFSTSTPLHNLQRNAPRHLDYSRSLSMSERNTLLAQDVKHDLEFLEDLLNRLDIYEHP